MHSLAKKIVTNEAMQPIAVQIDYADWLEIEPLLNQYPLMNQVTTFKHDASVWQHQWCELAQQIDKAWISEKSAVELLGEMRR